MRISGNEPSSVILRPTVVSKVENVDLKEQKQAEVQFPTIGKRTIVMLLKRYESTAVDLKTWLHVPSGTHWSTSSNTHQVVEM